MPANKDNGRVSLHKLILLMRIAKCCQQGNVTRSIANLCSIHGLNSILFHNFIQGSVDISIVSPSCEQEFDRLLYDWFDSADWTKYYNFDPELVRAAGQIMSNPGFTTKLSMLGKHCCEKLGISEDSAQQSLF